MVRTLTPNVRARSLTHLSLRAEHQRRSGSGAVPRLNECRARPRRAPCLSPQKGRRASRSRKAPAAQETGGTRARGLFAEVLAELFIDGEYTDTCSLAPKSKRRACSTPTSRMPTSVHAGPKSTHVGKVREKTPPKKAVLSGARRSPAPPTENHRRPPTPQKAPQIKGLKRRGRDSNPRWTKPPIPVFETGAFNRSATSPVSGGQVRRPGRGSGAPGYSRRSAKNARSRSPHSSARSPACSWGR
jgi:hypothetical protein